MSDRTSSTFRAGPLSPSSPASGALKESQRHPVASDHVPQTPTSPPLMSVSDQSHVSNFASSQTSPNQTTAQHPNVSSPPSSTPMSTQVSQQPAMSTTNSFPTPASSVSGHPANVMSTEETMQDSTGNSNQQATEHRRTDHDRQPEAMNPATGIHNFATEPNQGAADVDAMDVDKESLHRPVIPGLDFLQKNFTSAFHLCKSCKDSLKLTMIFPCRVIPAASFGNQSFVNTVFFVP